MARLCDSHSSRSTRQALVRILQAVNFGEIPRVRVQDADPDLRSTTRLWSSTRSSTRRKSHVQSWDWPISSFGRKYAA